MKPKVLYIMSSYNIYGGTPKKTLDLVRYFKSDAIIYVYTNNYSEFKNEYDKTGAKVVEGFYGQNLFKHCLKLHRIIRGNRIQLIHTQFTFGEIIGYFVKIFNPKTHLVIAFVGALEPPKKYRWLLNYIYKRIKNVIYISNFVKQEKEKQFPALVNKNHEVIYNGTEKRKGEKYNFEKRQGYSILAVCSLIELKNLEVVIEAMNILVHQIGRKNIFFYVAGDGIHKQRLMQLIEDFNLKEHIVLLGNQTNVGGLLNASDLFVHPSYKEGFGIAVAEAMFARKPIIVSNAGALPELIEHEKTGLIVDPFDANAWAEAILRLEEDKELATTLSENAYYRADKDFSVQRFAKNYEDFYKSLIKEDGR